MVLDLLDEFASAQLSLRERYGEPEPDSDWLVDDPRVATEHRGLGPDSTVVRRLKGCPCDTTSHEPPSAAGWNYPVGPEHPNGFASPEARRPVWLRRGLRIDRFGNSSGQFLSDEGVAWEHRALPPHTLSAGYHVYEVVRPIAVWSGPAAACFGHPGGGVQHYLGDRYTVYDLLENGYLIEVVP
jgi:Tuberculosis necrotizing toxin